MLYTVISNKFLGNSFIWLPFGLFAQPHVNGVPVYISFSEYSIMIKEWLGCETMEDQSIEFAKENKKQFLERLVEGVIPEEPGKKIAVFMAGSPGAGKTEVATGLAEIFKNVVIIDADVFRSCFPGYNGHNSDEFQKGSSLIAWS